MCGSRGGASGRIGRSSRHAEALGSGGRRGGGRPIPSRGGAGVRRAPRAAISAAAAVGASRLLRGGHRLPLTALSAADDGATAFTASKDGALCRWDTETGARSPFPAAKPPTTDQRHRAGLPAAGDPSRTILAVASTSDGRLVATGGADRLVRVWDARTLRQVHTFPGHRGTITCLAFRLGTQQLFSGSLDRTIKVGGMG